MATHRWKSLLLPLLIAVGFGGGVARAAAGDQSLAIGAVQNFTLHAAPKPVAPISFQDPDGRVLGLADFRGKVILLNLWATWCAPCRREMPAIDRLQARLGGKDFQVVALSMDRAGVAKVGEFFADLGIERLTPYVDPTTRAGRALGAFGLPTTLLIDRTGRELGRLVGPAEWDAPEAAALLRHFIDQVDGAGQSINWVRRY